jgi:PTS system galactitol-specific IIC component
MFPLQIGINLALLRRGWTSCLNVDLWNVWHKAMIGAFAASMFPDPRLGIAVGFVLAAIWIVLELATGDRTREQVYRLTGIPGVAIPHAMFLDAVWMAPALDVLDRLLPTASVPDETPDWYGRLGILAERPLAGLLYGLAFAVIAGSGLAGGSLLAVHCASAVVLFPMVAGLLSRALTPFSDAVQRWLQERSKGSTVFIGLDWPILTGLDAANWTRVLIQVPSLLVSLVLPGNSVLPLAGATVGSAITTAAVLSQGDLARTVLLSLLGLPIHLWAASHFAPYLTQLARQTGVLPAVSGQIAWLGIDGAGMRLLLFSVVKDLSSGGRMGWVLGLGVSLLVVYYLRSLERRERRAAERSGGAPGSQLQS